MDPRELIHTRTELLLNKHVSTNKLKGSIITIPSLHYKHKSGVFESNGLQRCRFLIH